MAVETPDIAGFIAASQQLRENFGSTVTFHVPNAPTWPAGTQINPDTGRPYSPMVKQTNTEYTDVDKTALIILKQGSPLRPQTDERFVEAGLLSSMDIILDLDVVDWPDVEAATEFTVNGDTYSLEEWKPFGLANRVYRYLVYGMEK